MWKEVEGKQTDWKAETSAGQIVNTQFLSQPSVIHSEDHILKSFDHVVSIAIGLTNFGHLGGTL